MFHFFYYRQLDDPDNKNFPIQQLVCSLQKLVYSTMNILKLWHHLLKIQRKYFCLLFDGRSVSTRALSMPVNVSEMAQNNFSDYTHPIVRTKLMHIIMLSSSEDYGKKDVNAPTQDSQRVTRRYTYVVLNLDRSLRWIYLPD